MRVRAMLVRAVATGTGDPGFGDVVPVYCVVARKP